ncbi:MAG: alkane 1-monooxygenase, partial [Pseudomonadota bacterium]
TNPITNETSGYQDSRRRLWLSQPFLPLLPSAGCLLAWVLEMPLLYWIAAVAWFGFTAMLDELLPKDDNNPPVEVLDEIEIDPYYRNLLKASAPSYLINFIFVCWYIANTDLTLSSYLGIAVSMGIVSGLALAVGHEFGHKTSYSDRRWGKFFLGVGGVWHFLPGHLRSHHVHVATPVDSSSSRLGESLYQFGIRSQLGFIRETWQAETDKLARKNSGPISLQNEMVQTMGITYGLFGALTIAFGFVVLPMLLIQQYVCWWYLSLIEYCQHYGMKRDQKEDGSYLPFTEQHSWNTNMLASNNLLVNFVRHSPHHLRSTRWYHALRDHESAPVLPYCYPLMFLAAMVPPLYYRIMDHRVVDWATRDANKINFHPPAEADIRQRFAI